MSMGRYSADCKRVTDLSESERLEMASLYLAYYENCDEKLFFSDLDEKDEVFLIHEDQAGLVGFSTLLFYKRVFEGQSRAVVFSGDTIVRREHWGQQALSARWLQRISRLAAECDGEKLYWFLVVKGHRTYRFLPVFMHSFHPHWEQPRSDLKRLADFLAADRFGDDYNPTSGVVEFKKACGNLREEIALPTDRERQKKSVQFFLKRNPNYARGNELVCLCELAPENLKPFTRRIVEGGGL